MFPLCDILKSSTKRNGVSSYKFQRLYIILHNIRVQYNERNERCLQEAFCCHGNGGSLPGRMHAVFPRVLSPLSRRVLSVQRPDSIDPHLLAVQICLGWNRSLSPRRKEIPRNTRKRGSGKLGTRMDSTDPVPRGSSREIR